MREELLILVLSLLLICVWLTAGIALENINWLYWYLVAILVFPATHLAFFIGSSLRDALRQRRIKKLNKQLALLNQEGNAQDVWDFATKHGVCLTFPLKALVFHDCDATSAAAFTASLAHIMMTPDYSEKVGWCEDEKDEEKRIDTIAESVGVALARSGNREHGEFWCQNFLEGLHDSRHPSLAPAVKKYYLEEKSDLSIIKEIEHRNERRKKLRKQLGLKPEVR